MAGFTSAPTVLRQSELQVSATKKHDLGTVAVTADGRKFRYVQAGAANVAIGVLVQSPVLEANVISVAVPANTAAGATSLTVTNGDVTVTAQQFTDGLAVVSEGSGAGAKYRISSHAAAANGTALTLQLAEPLQAAALSTTTKVDIVPLPYKGVITSPVVGEQTGILIGATVVAIPATQFGWVQSAGPAVLLVEGTPAAGAPVGLANGIVGAVSADTTLVVGQMIETGANAAYKLVSLDIE